MVGNNLLMFFFDFSPENIVIYLVLFGGISVLYMLFMPQLMGLQSKFAVRGAKDTLKSLKKWSDEARESTLEEISKHGRSKEDLEEEFNEFLEFFTISPVSEDPAGVLDRLDHLLDVRDKRYESKVKDLAPEAAEEEAADLEMALEGSLSTYSLYKIVRHYLRVAEKSGSYQLVQLLNMELPYLERMGKAYHEATKAFVDRKTIGDGIGPMVAAKLIGDSEFREGVKETVYARTEIKGRNVFVVKAKGPGGRVGKPGELIRKIANYQQPDRIFMIDAALKLEGEESGEIAEGVGAAIGGPPTEKHKIEEISTGKGIPVDAIVVKEGLKEAIVPMSEELSKSADSAVERIEKAITERTEEGDTVIVAGIGNTIGVGQKADEIPSEFPKVEKDEEELESFSIFGSTAGLLGSKGSNPFLGLKGDTEDNKPALNRRAFE